MGVMSEFESLGAELTWGPLRAYGEAALPVSGVYTAWLRGEEQCLYVGRANCLRDRIHSHYSGQRGSDQFCLYIYDRFVCQQRIEALTTAEVNRLTRDWIRQNVQFRWVEVPVEITASVEVYFRRSIQPLLNPLPRKE